MFQKLLQRVVGKLNTLFGIRLVVSMAGLVLFTLVLAVLAFLFFNPAPPKKLVMLGGEDGSSYRKIAEKYQKLLAKQGIQVVILPSEGSRDNLKKLADPSLHVDVGFVQAGNIGQINVSHLESLGSISYQPLMIFYRGAKKNLLSEFKGLRLDIGEEGSGTRALAETLLAVNGVKMNEVTLLHVANGDVSQRLLHNDVDAVFMMGDSASSEVMRKLMHMDNVRMFSFMQADAYTRRIKYLNKLILPQGALDFGKNLPSEDCYLVAPAVELIARDNLHPALSDLLLDAAREVHGGAGLFRKRGEFPALLEHEIPISQQARNYFESGRNFLYDNLPFWLASFLNRIAIALVPIFLLLIPGLRFAPMIYRWHMESRIYPWYGALMALERDAFAQPLTAKSRHEYLHRLDHIEYAVNKIKTPAAFGDLFYNLRMHIGFLRARLQARSEE